MADDPAPAPPAPPAPAPTPSPPAPAPRPPAEPETFSREYVTELRNENRGWRLKAQEQEQKRAEAEAAVTEAQKKADEAIAAAKAEAEGHAKTAEERANERIIRAELRTAALKAGMVDLDGLKLADLSEVTLNDKGEVEGADALMTKLKEAKPYLFGKPLPGNTNPNDPPNPNPPAPKLAKDMSPEEYQAAKAAVRKGAKA